jgi:hypothetical protein
VIGAIFQRGRRLAGGSGATRLIRLLCVALMARATRTALNGMMRPRQWMMVNDIVNRGMDRMVRRVAARLRTSGFSRPRSANRLPGFRFALSTDSPTTQTPDSADSAQPTITWLLYPLTAGPTERRHASSVSVLASSSSPVR